ASLPQISRNGAGAGSCLVLHSPYSKIILMDEKSRNS
ncbi:hypothetical protein CISIN_1g0477471mg, partial [Citrus sinensis]